MAFMLVNAHIPTEGMSTQSKLLLNCNVIFNLNAIFYVTSLFSLFFINSAQLVKGEKGKRVCSRTNKGIRQFGGVTGQYALGLGMPKYHHEG